MPCHAMPTPRNLFVLGFSIFFALVLPKWMEAQPNSPISTGSSSLDSILTVTLSSSMFIALVLGFTLDNTIPGQCSANSPLEQQPYLVFLPEQVPLRSEAWWPGRTSTGGMARSGHQQALGPDSRGQVWPVALP